MNRTTYGLDIAKNVMQLHWVEIETGEIGRKKLGRAKLSDYFARLRGVRLAISGADLAELGLGESPRVGEVLTELKRRKLNGELDGRESELAAARELIAAP